MLPSMLREKLETNVKVKKRPLNHNKIENTQKKIKFSKNHHKKVTLDDMNQLQFSHESLDTSNENLFVQQIDEIVKTTQVTGKYQTYIDFWYTEFNNFIKTIPSDEKSELVNNIKWLNKDVFLPLNETNVNIPNFNFKFITPSKTLILGSHATATSTGPNLNVDIAVEIPSDCFEKDDFMNMIYHKKKALYLSYLALKLQKSEHIKELQFTFFKDDSFCPVLEIKHTSRSHKHLKFYLRIICEKNAFKLNRFLPSTSNVRQCLFNDTNTEIMPTPHYNSSILSDLVLISNHEFLINTLCEHSKIRDAIILLKLWLRSKGLEFNRLNGYILSMFATYLLKCRKINITMSSYAIIKSIWLQIGIY